MTQMSKFVIKLDSQDQVFRTLEENYTRVSASRSRTVLAMRKAASMLDDIAEVQKGLEVGGGVVSVLGKSILRYITEDSN